FRGPVVRVPTALSSPRSPPRLRLPPVSKERRPGWGWYPRTPSGSSTTLLLTASALGSSTSLVRCSSLPSTLPSPPSAPPTPTRSGLATTWPSGSIVHKLPDRCVRKRNLHRHRRTVA